MPKFKVHCTKLASSRVVLEVEAPSERVARMAVEQSEDPCVEFEEVGEFDEGHSDVTVQGATRVKDKVG